MTLSICARRIYEEMLSVLGSEVDMREDSAEKASKVRELLLGYQVDEVFPTAFEV